MEGQIYLSKYSEMLIVESRWGVVWVFTTHSSNLSVDLKVFTIKCWRKNWSTCDERQDLKNYWNNGSSSSVDWRSQALSHFSFYPLCTQPTVAQEIQQSGSKSQTGFKNLSWPFSLYGPATCSFISSYFIKIKQNLPPCLIYYLFFLVNSPKTEAEFFTGYWSFFFFLILYCA